MTAVVTLLLPVAVFVVVWPLVELAVGRRQRRTRPATHRQASYRPGRAQVRYTSAVYVGGAW